MLNDDGSPKRLVLPLSSLMQDPPIHRVPPRQPTRISAYTKNGAFDIEHIFIAAAGTLEGAGDWVVNDVEVDGRSQLILKDLPGALFATKGIARSRRGSTKFSFHDLDSVERGRALTLVVTYIGLNPEGVPFFGSAIGTRPARRPTVVPIASKAPLLPVTNWVPGERPSQAATITVRVQNAPFRIGLIEINDGDTAGGAADWIVNDLRVDGRTQFRQSGDIPGDMFSTVAIDSFVAIETCPAGSAIEIDVSYIGLNERGETFKARLEGTVTLTPGRTTFADDTVPPPDLHVVVETSGHGPGEAVIATCDWRPPAVDDSAP
jgi:hypothetical protein